MIGKGHEESFWAAINVLQLDLDGGYLDVNICKDPSSSTLIIYTFVYVQVVSQ